MWVAVWLGQRTMEYFVVVHLQQSPDDELPKSETITLFTLNFTELGMELALYIAFINVLCILRRFLNSFDI